MLSSRLDTLRDMTEDSHIDPSSLLKVKDLGEGAFATGTGPGVLGTIFSIGLFWLGFLL